MKSGCKFNIIIPPQDVRNQPDCLERLACGDREALNWLYKNYSKKVYDYALILTADEWKAEDIVQDIFFRLWISREKLSALENFNTYLYTMVRNIIASEYTRQLKEKSARLGFTSRLSRTCFSLQEQIEEHDLKRVITKAVRQLPPQQQRIYQLKREYGFHGAEIASALNLSTSTIKNHMKMGLRSLKKQVVDRILQ